MRRVVKTASMPLLTTTSFLGLFSVRKLVTRRARVLDEGICPAVWPLAAYNPWLSDILQCLIFQFDWWVSLTAVCRLVLLGHALFRDGRAPTNYEDYLSRSLACERRSVVMKRLTHPCESNKLKNMGSNSPSESHCSKLVLVSWICIYHPAYL